MKKYKCAECDREFEAQNKYKLAEQDELHDFSCDIDDYEESGDGVNVFTCGNCRRMEG